MNKNSFILKTIYFRFKNIFALQMIYKRKRFRFNKNFTFVSKAPSLCKWFINEKKNFFSFRKHFHFFLENFFILQKKRKSKAIRKQIASDFLVVAHACHPALRASVSTWEGLLCRFSYVDVWLQQAARDLKASTCKLVLSLSLLSSPILGEMSLRNLWHKTYDLCLRVSEWYLFDQEKRMDCVHGEWWFIWLFWLFF